MSSAAWLDAFDCVVLLLFALYLRVFPAEVVNLQYNNVLKFIVSNPTLRSLGRHCFRPQDKECSACFSESLVLHFVPVLAQTQGSQEWCGIILFFIFNIFDTIGRYGPGYFVLYSEKGLLVGYTSW